MTSRPRKDDLKTSQLPRHPSTHLVQMPEAGATSLERFDVFVASFAFGRCSVPIVLGTPLFRHAPPVAACWLGGYCSRVRNTFETKRQIHRNTPTQEAL